VEVEGVALALGERLDLEDVPGDRLDRFVALLRGAVRGAGLCCCCCSSSRSPLPHLGGAWHMWP